MKILILINAWLRLSGGDYHITKISQEWSNKHKISYLLPKSGYKKLKTFIKKGNFLVYSLPLDIAPRSTFLIPLIYLLRSVKLFFSLPKEKFDLVVASSPFLPDILVAMLLKHRDKSKVVTYVHGPISFDIKNFRQKLLLIGHNIIYPIIGKISDLVFTVNRTVTDFLLEKHQFNKEKVILTANGIDLKGIKHDAFKKEHDGCFIGRLVEGKGIFDLIFIWKEIIKSKPDAKLIIMGDGPDKNKLEKLINDNDLANNISLLGFVDEKTKFENISKSRLLLFPSIKDSWPIPVTESMACGVPAVMYDIPECREIFNEAVQKVKLKEISKFSRKVLELLNDDKKVNQLKNKALLWARDHDWKIIAKNQLIEIERTSGLS